MCEVAQTDFNYLCSLKHRQGDLMRYAGNLLVKKKPSNPVKVRKG